MSMLIKRRQEELENFDILQDPANVQLMLYKINFKLHDNTLLALLHNRKFNIIFLL